jgi:hypothetical protein
LTLCLPDRNPPKQSEQSVPPEVRSYLELQSFVKARAAAAGIET